MLATILSGLVSYFFALNFQSSGNQALLARVLDILFFQPAKGNVLILAGRAGLGLAPGAAEASRGEIRRGGGLPLAEDRSYAPPRKATSSGFSLTASSGAVLDLRSGEVLFVKDADRPMPIASITKLATALIFLKHNPGWDTVYQLKASDGAGGSKPYLATGDRVKIKDLFYLSLVASGNTETMALVGASGLTRDDYLEEINAWARQQGLEHTVFVDPVGLKAGNVSTAREVAALTKAALEEEAIRTATLTKKHEFTTLDGRKISVRNTDSLLESFSAQESGGIRIVGGKTGYTEEAGGCFASKFSDRSGNEIVSVVLGGSDRQARFSETRDLVEWIYDAYRWQ